MGADGSARLARLASHVVPRRLAQQQRHHRHPAATAVSSSSPRESAAIEAQIERYKEQARASDDPAVQVEANVCAYSDTFVLANRQNDPQLLQQWWGTPGLLLTARGARPLADADAVSAFYGRGMPGLVDSGYADSRLYDFDVTMLNDGSALAKCQCDRMKADGSQLAHFTPQYLVARGKEEGQWLIVGMVAG